jgi:hypothetical protein
MSTTPPIDPFLHEYMRLWQLALAHMAHDPTVLQRLLATLQHGTMPPSSATTTDVPTTRTATAASTPPDELLCRIAQLESRVALLEHALATSRSSTHVPSPSDTGSVHTS